MPSIFTIGHSTRSMAEFLALLAGQGIRLLADVRTIPKSRAYPHFAGAALAASLPSSGIAYRHLPDLGGLRHAHPNSENQGWKNASFRGFADYMQTETFAAACAELEQQASAKTTAIMCAEAVPWRCHRSLIADALSVRGWEVRDIIGAQTPKPHRLTPFLRVVEGRLSYPA